MDANDPKTMPSAHGLPGKANTAASSPAANPLQSHRETSILRNWVIRGSLTILILLIFTYLGKQIVLLYEPAPHLEVPPALSVFTGARAGHPVIVQFGNAPHSILQQEIHGGEDIAIRQLREACRKAATWSNFPDGIPSSAETELLQSLLKDKTINASDEGVIVCSIDPDAPVFIGIRHAPQNVAEPVKDLSHQARIMSWGFATQTQKDRWKLRVVSRTAVNDNPSKDASVLALPPGSRQLLQMRSANGESVLAFASDSELGKQIIFFDRFFENGNWKQNHAWHTSDHSGQGVYTRNLGQRSETAHIHLHRKVSSFKNEPQDKWWGIINLASQPHAP
jgi:hypothetical protein